MIRPLSLKKNKKGQMGLILLFLLILTIVMGGIIAATVGAVLNWFGDEITPVMTSLGVIDVNENTSINVSEAGEWTFGTLNVFLQALPWFVGLAYGCALIFTFVFVVGYQTNPHPVFLGFYASLMILLVFGTIILSNIYQEMHVQNNVVGDRLREQTMMSYMILYSPHIMLLIAVICGIILFSRSPGESGGGIDIGI